MSKHSDSEEESINKNYTEVFESSQICFRFAEEIRILRLELLSLKQEKRTWLASITSHEEDVTSRDGYIKQLKLEISQLNEAMCIEREKYQEQDERLKRLKEENTDLVVSLHKANLDNSALNDSLNKVSKRVKSLQTKLQLATESESNIRLECIQYKKDLEMALNAINEAKVSAECTHLQYKKALTDHSSILLLSHNIAEKAQALFQLLSSVSSNTEKSEVEDWLCTHNMSSKNSFVLEDDSQAKIVVIIHACRYSIIIRNCVYDVFDLVDRMMVKRLLARHDRLKVYSRKLMTAVEQFGDIEQHDSANEAAFRSYDLL